MKLQLNSIATGAILAVLTLLFAVACSKTPSKFFTNEQQADFPSVVTAIQKNESKEDAGLYTVISKDMAGNSVKTYLNELVHVGDTLVVTIKQPLSNDSTKIFY